MGLYFEILAVESDKVYERRGRIQRIAGIDRQWFHHADAVRVPESVFARFSGTFRSAHPEFNYYGPTEYKGQDILRLCNELRAVVHVETEEVVQKIVAVAEQALSSGRSLLVLGI
jgi:hypothetical protein